jgi:hypothetical protein
MTCKFEPNDLQVKRWQLSVQRELGRPSRSEKNTRAKLMLQLLAAALIGFMVGGLYFKAMLKPENSFESIAEFTSENATFERVHSNLD